MQKHMKKHGKKRHNSDPPHQLMFEKLDTTVNPHTNRDPAL